MSRYTHHVAEVYIGICCTLHFDKGMHTWSFIGFNEHDSLPGLHYYPTMHLQEGSNEI